MTKVLSPNKRLHRIRGKIRMLFGFCPRCNYDAPEIDVCAVCKQHHLDTQLTTGKGKGPFPPNRATKALWWYTWMHPAFEQMQNDYMKWAIKK